jgi:hypothetical protein
MNATMTREIGARVWAKKIYGCDHLVCDLKRGDLFSFPESVNIHEYLGRGWYRATGASRAYRIGTRTAIIKK